MDASFGYGLRRRHVREQALVDGGLGIRPSPVEDRGAPFAFVRLEANYELRVASRMTWARARSTSSYATTPRLTRASRCWWSTAIRRASTPEPTHRCAGPCACLAGGARRTGESRARARYSSLSLVESCDSEAEVRGARSNHDGEILLGLLATR